MEFTETAEIVRRKPRSDGQLNRQRIVEVAKQAFTERGAGASLDDIAKTACVGAGTLYRHFPTRQALLEAVYCADVDHLAKTAEQLAQELPPMEAIRAWLLLFIDHLATKKVIAPALQSLMGNENVIEKNMPRIRPPVGELYRRAIESGELLPDVNPQDHLRAIVGASFFGEPEEWRQSATRLVEVLLRGSTVPR